MKQSILNSLLFVLGFALATWLFRWDYFGTPERAWFTIPYRFGTGWELRVDFDFDGKADLVDRVKPREHLMSYVFGFASEARPDFREVRWKCGPVKYIRVWYLPARYDTPSFGSPLVAVVALQGGPEVVVAGQGKLCAFLSEQAIPPFWFWPGLGELGCEVPGRAL